MSRHTMITFMATAGCLAGQVAVASAQEVEPEVAQLLEAVDEAEQAAKYEDALKLLERAYQIDEDGYYIYRRAMIYERQGEPEQALRLLKEQRGTIAASERVTDLPMAIERLEQAVGSDGGRLDPVREPDTGRPVAAWALTGLGGASLIAGGVLFLLGRGAAFDLTCSPNSAGAEESRCDGRADSPSVDSAGEWNEAWRIASRRQTGGVVTMAVGGAALLGGLAWLAASGSNDERAVWRIRLDPRSYSRSVSADVVWSF